MGIWYATREDVQSALDVKTTPRDVAQIDRAIEAVSRGIERAGSLDRVFYPLTATRRFDWPHRPVWCNTGPYFGGLWRIWLNESDLISATSVTVNGVALNPGDYTLEPANEGPPFYRIDIPTTLGLNIGSTRKNAVAVLGLFGHSDDAAPAGQLVGGVTLGAGSLVVSDSSLVGVGSLLKIGAERLPVTGRTMASTTAVLTGNPTASNADALVGVSSGALVHPGEVVLVDAERMLVVDVAGNGLVVKRAWDGTVLAPHVAGATVFAPRSLTVARGQLGTAADVHNDADPVTTWAVPGPVRDLCIAEVLNRFEQERSAYARTVGAGESLRNASGAGLADIRAQAYASHGRKTLTMVH